MLNHHSKAIDSRIPIILIMALLAFILVMLRESAARTSLDCKCSCTDTAQASTGGYGPRLSNLENEGAGGNSAELLQQ